MCQRLIASVVALILYVAPSLLFSQAILEPSGEITTVTRIVPGTARPDGLTSPATFHRYHITSADYLPHALLVKTRQYIDAGKNGSGLLDGEIGAILRPYGVTAVRAPFPDFAEQSIASADRYGMGRMYEVTFSAPGDVLKLCEQLMKSNEVEYAEPRLVRRTTGMPDDPRVNEQYALARVEAEGAWAISEGDTSVTIAIVDSGIDWMHEDLAANIWTNPNEIPDNKIDDDDNGFVDDVRGWDFVGNLPIQLALLNQYLPDNDPGIPLDLSTRDGRYHGTHCAGVAGAVTNNGKGIAGMSYHTRLIPVKVGSDMIEGSIYRGYEAIMYAANLGADIISCSWGGGVYSQAEQDVIDQATEMGSLVVAAAGNDALNTDNFKHYPSSYRNVLSVGASDSKDVSAGFSNYGIQTAVFAPGVNILSTVGGNNRYDGNWSGTSMATPLVSGLAALLKSAHPDWTPGEIAAQIRSTVDNVIVTDSLARPLYFGRINARRALEMNRSGVDTGMVPGIGLIDVGVEAPDGIISDNAEKQVRLTLRNYLAPVRNLRVTVTPLGDEVTITNATATIDSLDRMSTADVDLNLSVTGSTTWYEGTADLLVRFDADGYVDFELVQVPYRFTSENTFTLLVSGLPGKTDARAGHSPAQGIFWGVGEVPGLGGGFIRFFGTNYNYNFVSPQALTSIFAFDYLRAYTVSGSIVYSTINGGGGWRNTPVASITQSLKNVHFFSSDVGIILGSPLNGAWGIGTTADGGTTWNPVAGLPAAATDEDLVETAVAWRDDYGWFGTSAGRVFRTSDRGTGWNVSEVKSGAAISHLSFITPEQGIALYHDPDEAGGALTLAATTDGGATWQTDVVRMDALGIVPVHLAPPGATGAHVMLGNDGRVMLSSDNGTTWIPEASSKTNALISAGTTSYDGERIRVWSLGTSVGHLDIPYTASSAPVAVVAPSMPLRVVSIHPNPTAEKMTIQVSLERQSDIVVELMNEVGQVVLRRDAGRLNVGESALVLDLASLPSGNYLCRITAGGAVQGRVVTVRR